MKDIHTRLFFLVVTLNSIGLVFPTKENAVHPEPVKLIGVHHYEVLRNGVVEREHLPPGLYEVGKANGYIFGVVMDGDLCPIHAPRADLDNRLGRVRVRIDGAIANVTVGIKWGDPMCQYFYREYDIENPTYCMDVEIPA